jgi:hypothetical protein
LNAQIIKGKLCVPNDSSVVVSATVACFNVSDQILNGVNCETNGDFQINLPFGVDYLKITSLGYSVVKIIRVQASLDTINIESIPLIRLPEIIQVQFKGISSRKEKKCRENIIKEYNKRIKKYGDLKLCSQYRNFKLIKMTERKNVEGRKGLLYIIDFNKINN